MKARLKMTSKYHRVSITIEKEIWDEALLYAKKIGISASALLRMCFLNYKKQQQKGLKK